MKSMMDIWKKNSLPKIINFNLTIKDQTWKTRAQNTQKLMLKRMMEGYHASNVEESLLKIESRSMKVYVKARRSQGKYSIQLGKESAALVTQHLWQKLKSRARKRNRIVKSRFQNGRSNLKI